jgi:hypothetical protein
MCGVTGLCADAFPDDLLCQTAPSALVLLQTVERQFVCNRIRHTVFEENIDDHHHDP